MQRSPLIELVSVHHEGRCGAVLRDATLQIWPGETVAIRASAGAGKTTLLRILAGLVSPSQGTRAADGSVGAGGVAFLSQRPSFLLTLTAVEHVMVGLLAKGLRDQARVRERAMQGLLAAGLAHMAATSMRQLCGAERRLVLVAEMLALGAPLVFVDEGYGASVAKLASPERTLVLVARETIAMRVDRWLHIDAHGSVHALVTADAAA